MSCLFDIADGLKKSSADSAAGAYSDKRDAQVVLRKFPVFRSGRRSSWPCPKKEREGWLEALKAVADAYTPLNLKQRICGRLFHPDGVKPS